ncbi:hypothetical protein Rwratislav_44041 [Rhodococcus wratislaviensis IFP 2016]|nr:hypothetical protein Rwratislav_44041 [Rhodococcus wratislaviensis IFP 2016]
MIDLPALAHIPSIVAELVAALSVPALVPHLLLAIAGVGAGALATFSNSDTDDCGHRSRRRCRPGRRGTIAASRQPRPVPSRSAGRRSPGARERVAGTPDTDFTARP